MVLLGLLVLMTVAAVCPGVSSTITRHGTAAVLLKGETDKTTISSEGTIALSRATRRMDLGDYLDNVWAINTIAADCEGAVYLGTSPNGEIVKYADGKAERLYPAGWEEMKQKAAEDPNAAEPLTNEHIFALAVDGCGRLLAGVSGDDCRLLRFCGGTSETLFSAEGVRYIFAIVTDKKGNIYLGTGPAGGIYRVGGPGKKAELIYDARDKNILSLALGKGGFLYAGCDERGLVYKVNVKKKTATVLYDAEQDEITALLFDEEGNLYAAATSAQAVKEKVATTSISADGGAGRPESKSEKKKDADTTTLEVANTGEASSEKEGMAPPETPKGALPKSAGRIYRIDPDGFVKSVFSEMAVFYSLVHKDNRLLLATGNNGQLFSIDPLTEDKAVAYEDGKSSQVTALAKVAGGVLMGCANPAGLIRLDDAYEGEGTYTSSLIDAGQPAKWGKLQVKADIPQGCSIMLSAHSGNVDDPNDPTFSAWTQAVELTEATDLDIPVGRFCQYRLSLSNTERDRTPVIEEIAAAHVVPNLAPQVTAVEATRVADKNKPGVFMVTCVAKDANKDPLIYRIDFRKIGRSRWIELKDKLTAPKLEWDTRTVEDGRYEVRVTADDRGGNSTATALTGSRISDPLVVDNTAPVVEDVSLEVKRRRATITARAVDEYTVIGRLRYTVDSDEEWKSALPDDSVYDTTSEDFTIVIKGLGRGEHVVALKISDDLGNTVYKTLDVSIK